MGALELEEGSPWRTKVDNKDLLVQPKHFSLN
jgi:hypothetical protein